MQNINPHILLINEDEYGHRTRFSDSSLYDEKCVLCGATDAIGSNSLKRECPNRINIDVIDE